MKSFLISAVVLTLVSCCQIAAAQDYQSVKDSEASDQTGFQRFFVTDRFDRKITCYLSELDSADSAEKLPLVICIQGSGSQSIFLEVDTADGKVIASGGTEAVLRRKFRDKLRVLVVEKPGVEFLVQPSRPGAAEEASEEYNREFSLERWVEALNAATCAITKLPGIDGERVLALGHSEGGQVACELAAVNDLVTHVAHMAGGGPTQLYDFIEMAREGEIFDPQASPDDRVKSLMAQWQIVLDNPDATDQFFMGHAHLRWTTFLRSSPISAILKTDAKVFIAQGMKDTNSLPASADVLYAELMARGRDVTYKRIIDGDHAFMTDGDNGEGWLQTISSAAAWFLEDE